MKDFPTAEELEALFREGKMARIGMGSRRTCYKIPASNLCVKCYRSEDEIKEGKYNGSVALAPSVVREIVKARFDEKRNTSCQEYRYWKKLKGKLPSEVFAAFPQKMECVLVPARGWCLVEERLENFDGSKPEDFKSAYFAADDKIKKSLLSAFLRLIEQFRFYAVRFYGNFAVERVFCCHFTADAAVGKCAVCKLIDVKGIVFIAVNIFAKYGKQSVYIRRTARASEAFKTLCYGISLLTVHIAKVIHKGNFKGIFIEE